MTTITILLADDHAIVRAGLRLLLEAEPDFEVVGEAADGVEAVAEAIRLHPTVVLMDVTMPRTNGLDAAAQVSRSTDSRILMLSMQDDLGYVRRAFAAGASGYVLKEVVHSQLVSAVRTVAAGERHLDETLEARLAADHAKQLRDRSNPLSPREHAVLTLLALGHTNREIADQLSISIRTAETHRAHIMQKLELNTRADLVRYALATGRLHNTAA